MAEADSPALKFFVGLHHPGDGRHFDRCCISINVLDCEGCVAEVEIGPGQKIVTLIAGAKADILAEVMPGNYLTRARDLTHGLARPPYPIILCVCSEADALFLARLSAEEASGVAWQVLRCKQRADAGGPALH